MARLKGHAILDYAQPLYVRTAGVKWDRTYVRGELFPWRDLKVTPSKLHQLWMQRRIGHERLGDPNRGAEDMTKLVAPPPPLPPPVAVALPTPVVATPVPAPIAAKSIPTQNRTTAFDDEPTPARPPTRKK